MAGKFINTKYNDTVDSLVEGYKDRLKNPYYMHSDKSPTIVEYFRLNKQASSLDEGLYIEMSRTGAASPLRFSLIHNFIVYGIEQLVAQLVEDSGLKSEDIEGRALVLPNTINPIPGDYFVVSYMENKFLFCVQGVNVDTLESGANFHEISFYVDTTEKINDIMDQVVDEYNYIVNNTGTEFNPVIRKSDYNFISDVEKLTIMLKKYYKELFYSPRIDTFILTEQTLFNYYDPYLIEFIINNKILEGDDEYLFICHQLPKDRMFSFKYRNTLFFAIENKDKQKLHHANTLVNGVLVDHKKYPLSTMTQRMEPYFAVDYTDRNSRCIASPDDFNNTYPWVNESPTFEAIDNNIIHDITHGCYNNNINDIIVSYFDDKPLTNSMIGYINDLKYTPSRELFYNIPIIIFILEQYCRKLISNSKNI